MSGKTAISMLHSWEKKGNEEINLLKKLCCNPNPLSNQNVTEDYNSHVSAVRVGGENEGSWSSSCSLKLFACTRHGRGNKDSQTQTHARAHLHTQKPKLWKLLEAKLLSNIRTEKRPRKNRIKNPCSPPPPPHQLDRESGLQEKKTRQ
jgi:hypothetical protein